MRVDECQKNQPSAPATATPAAATATIQRPEPLLESVMAVAGTLAKRHTSWPGLSLGVAVSTSWVSQYLAVARNSVQAMPTRYLPLGRVPAGNTAKLSGGMGGMTPGWPGARFSWVRLLMSGRV